MGQQLLDPGVEKAEGDAFDLPDEDLGVVAFDRLLERRLDRLRQAVGDRPHRVERLHLGFQAPVEPYEKRDGCCATHKATKMKQLMVVLSC